MELESELALVHGSSREWIKRAKGLEGEVRQLKVLLTASGTLNFLQMLSPKE